MKRAILWLLQSYIYLVPFILILAGAYIFARFIPDYFGIMTFLWIVIVTFFMSNITDGINRDRYLLHFRPNRYSTDE